MSESFGFQPSTTEVPGSPGGGVAAKSLDSSKGHGFNHASGPKPLLVPLEHD